MKNLAQKLKKIKKPSEVHEKDMYSETHKLSKIRTNYEKAREELTVKPYSQRMQPLDNFLYGFRSVYHFISVILGLATCALVSLVFVGIDAQGNEQFPPWLLILMAVLIGGLLVGVLVGVEMAKVTIAKNIFKAKAKRDSIGTFPIVALTFLVFVSIALSGVGGALLSYKMGDKTQQLGETLKTGENKVAKQYDQRLAQLNEIIAALEKLSVDKKARKWGLTDKEQTNLQTSKVEKIQLLAAKEKALVKLSTQYENKLNMNQSNTSMTMYIALGIITFLELMTIYAYAFHYQYLARTESEGVQFSILESQEQAQEQPSLAKSQEPSQPQDLNQALVNLLGQVLTGQVLQNQDLGQVLAGQVLRPISNQDLKPSLKQKRKPGFGEFWEKETQNQDKKEGTNLEGLIAEIREGQRHMPYLTKKYRVNIPTVNKLIKQYGV